MFVDEVIPIKKRHQSSQALHEKCFDNRWLFAGNSLCLWSAQWERFLSEKALASSAVETIFRIDSIVLRIFPPLDARLVS
jgi:hypothetical protein